MEFALPEIGEGVYEAELVRWLVAPGDAVRRGQNLLEVMTDKATMEVPSPFVGTVTSRMPRSYSSQRSSRLIWRVVRPAALNVAFSPTMSETFGISAFGSARPRAS